MKLGEIKIESLKLMFLNTNEDIQAEMLSKLVQNEAYKGYLINMPGAINRCFSNLEERRVLPSRSVELKPSDAVVSGSYMRFDLSSLGSFFDVDRVIRYASGEYNGNFDYIMEGNTLVIPYDTSAEYRLLYKPSLKRITNSTPNDTELNIPESIAALIPYFVKGDLFRDDEPNEAGEARNWYEQGILEISEKKYQSIGRIKTVYSMTE